jgi:hypothetical protein
LSRAARSLPPAVPSRWGGASAGHYSCGDPGLRPPRPSPLTLPGAALVRLRRGPAPGSQSPFTRSPYWVRVLGQVLGPRSGSGVLGPGFWDGFCRGSDAGAGAGCTAVRSGDWHRKTGLGLVPRSPECLFGQRDRCCRGRLARSARRPVRSSSGPVATARGPADSGHAGVPVAGWGDRDGLGWAGLGGRRAQTARERGTWIGWEVVV